MLCVTFGLKFFMTFPKVYDYHICVM